MKYRLAARCCKRLSFLAPGVLLSSCATNFRDAALDGAADFIQATVSGSLSSLIPLPEIIAAYWAGIVGG